MLVAVGPGSQVIETYPSSVPSDALKRWQRLLVIGSCVLGFLGFAAQIGLNAFMAGRIMPGVTVAGMEIGSMTRQEAKAVLERPVANHTLNVAVGSTAYKIRAGDIGASYNIDATLDHALAVGRNQVFVPLQFLAARNSQELAYTLKLNPKVETAFIDKMVGASGLVPVDASIVVKEGEPVVQPDVDGRALGGQAAANAIKKGLASFSITTLKLEPSVQHARIRVPDVEPAIAQTKQLLAIPVTISYENKVFNPTPAQKSGWITYQKSPQSEAPGLIPTLSKDGIKSYLQSLALQINVNPVNRKINVQNGNSQETQVGQDGLQLDQDALAAVIAAAVEAKQPVVAAAPTKKVPFQTEYNRSISLDYGKYIEINLSSQRLWVYENHQVIHEAPLTSGASAAGYATVTGLFSIQAKQTNRNLNGYAIGYDYNVFVKYWMPFHGNYGMHDASWRGGVFGGQDYKYNGSHGCVNLPEATAAFIYGWGDVGTPVWVHY